MAVPITTGAALQPGPPAVLFETHLLESTVYVPAQYDVAPDGQRFLVNTARRTAQGASVTVVLNWMSRLKQ